MNKYIEIVDSIKRQFEWEVRLEYYPGRNPYYIIHFMIDKAQYRYRLGQEDQLKMDVDAIARSIADKFAFHLQELEGGL